jgi:hypothetical protein
MTTLTTIVRGGRIKLDEPSDLPDGSAVEVTLRPAPSTIADTFDRGPVPADEIARVLAAMRMLPTWDIPDDVAAELDAWEAQINRHGIEHRDVGMENLFR